MPLQFDTPNTWRSNARRALGRHQRLVVFTDLIAVTTAALLAALLRFRDVFIGAHVSAYIPVIIAAWLIILTMRNSYSLQALQHRGRQASNILEAPFFVFPAVAGISYVFKDSLSRAFLIFAVIFSTSFLMLGRLLIMRASSAYHLLDPMQQRTLVIGQWVLPSQRTNQPQMSNVIEVKPPAAGDFDAWLESVVQHASNDHVDAVVLASDHNLLPAQVQRLSWALEGSVDLVSVVSVGTLGRRAFLRTTESGTYLHLLDVGLTGPKAFAKRLFDITVSSFSLLLLSPLFVLTGLAVRLSSRGPVFYVQERIGLHGVLFAFPKFRSMRVGAAHERAEILGAPDSDMLNRYRTDPRITKVGRVIRRLSIDEIPQIWSVLKGDMSIVGPRPVLVEEMDQVEHVDRRRHIAKPGLTGLWQVSGRKEVPWSERMRMDLEYIENWSLAGDVLLVIRTLGAVVTGRGAM
jgi:exopolysaccharide biosynthesis polyprenyl glycosylphosphotransferase